MDSRKFQIPYLLSLSTGRSFQWISPRFHLPWDPVSSLVSKVADAQRGCGGSARALGDLETLEIGEVKEDIGVTIEIPGLVNVYKKLWKDPPCYHWVNPLFRLGHVQ